MFYKNQKAKVIQYRKYKEPVKFSCMNEKVLTQISFGTFNPITPSAHICEHFLTDYNLPMKVIFPANLVLVF